MRCQSRRKVSEKEYFRGEKKFEIEREENHEILFLDCVATRSNFPCFNN